jgi:hypothetical protein
VGYRFVLVLQSGEPGEPGVFATLVPDWGVGDTFVVGSALRKFRILAIDPVRDDQLLRGIQSVWTVEPVDD